MLLNMTNESIFDFLCSFINFNEDEDAVDTNDSCENDDREYQELVAYVEGVREGRRQVIDVIENACDWLSKNAYKYDTSNPVHDDYESSEGDLVSDLRKYLLSKIKK